MWQTPDTSPYASRPGYLAEVTLALIQIRNAHATGRLSIRNIERFGIAHLYFKEARLTYVTGDKRDGEAVLNDLFAWSKGNIRFDQAIVVDYAQITWQQTEIFKRWLGFLEMRGLMQGFPPQQLKGLTQNLTVNLPARPITLPHEVTNYEEYEEVVATRQLRQVSQSAAHRISEFVHQAGHITQELARIATNRNREKTGH